MSREQVLDGDPTGWEVEPGRTGRLTAYIKRSSGGVTLTEHRRGFAPPPPLARGPDASLIDAVDAAGLRGRGGAGFPTATKLRAVASGKRRPIVVVNGSEGEPASRKDKLLMTSAPHLVLDGALLAAVAVGADEVICCVSTGARSARDSLARAIEERFAAEPATARVRLVDVPDRYVAGEERSLVHLLNRGPAIPTAAPPRPFERGVAGRPTLVQNVETLAHLSLIYRSGPAWFRSVGTQGYPGTVLVTLSGAVARPNVYEIPAGASLSGLLRSAGGTRDGVGGVLVGGYAGTWLSTAETSGVGLDPQGLATVGGILGCGAIVVLPAEGCGWRETVGVMRWLAGETAGQCGPCVHGLASIAGSAEDMLQGKAGARALERLQRWAGDVEGRGACRLPDGGVRLLRSALLAFGPDIERHLQGRGCLAARRPGTLPLPTPMVGSAA